MRIGNETRNIRKKAVAAVTAATLGFAATACGGGGSNHGEASPSVVGTSAVAPPASEGVPTVAPSTTERKEWDGTDATVVTWPGRVALPEATCQKWTADAPQPAILRAGRLFVVVDARQSVPPNCDYLTDSGAALYHVPAYQKSQVASIPSMGSFAPDGTVGQVVAAQKGEYACNPNGGSEVWLKVAFTPSDSGENTPAVFVPEINVGFLDDAQLAAAGIGITSSPYEGQRAGNC
jgi:hypothetical protein